MKAEIYNPLASLNQSFDLILESLQALMDEGVLTPEYVGNETVFLEEARAKINFTILQKLNARETEDRDHYGKMRASIQETCTDQRLAPAASTSSENH